MKHARAIVAHAFPGFPTLEASRKIVWIPDERGGCPTCKRNHTPRVLREDLLGCFDLIVLASPLILIQVTTQSEQGGGAAAARRRKVQEQYVSQYGANALKRIRPIPQAWVWAWKSRCYFYTWRWMWHRREWSLRGELHSPLINSHVAPRQQQAPTTSS